MPLRLALLGALTLCFVALVVWAIITGDFTATLEAVGRDPWLIVALADLYFGFTLFSVLIVWRERHWRAAPWILALMLLGNGVAAIWLLVRWCWDSPAPLSAPGPSAQSAAGSGN